MRWASRCALLVWPVGGALIACSTYQQLGKEDGGNVGYASGAGGEGQGSGGDGAPGGTGTHATGGHDGSTGGRNSGTGGTAGSPDSGETGGSMLGHAGQATAGQGPVEPQGLPGASSFTKLIIRSSGGMPPPPGDPEPQCDVGDDDGLTLHRASKTLNWAECQVAEGSSEPVVRILGRDLTDAEFQAALNTLSLVAPSTREMCGADKPVVTLELEVDGSSILYTDDFYKCNNDPGSTRYVENIDPLHGWLGALVNGLAVPSHPAALSVYTDTVLDQDPPTGSECASHYQPQYELDLMTGELSWEYCTTPADSGAFMLITGRRVLENAELETVLRAYSSLQLGVSGPCRSLEMPTSYYVTSVRVDDEVYLVDEAASCSADISGDYAVGVRGLGEVIEGLVR
jgi:hypothetical protein